MIFSQTNLPWHAVKIAYGGVENSQDGFNLDAFDVHDTRPSPVPSASADPTKVTLQWPAVDLASGYRVYRSDVTGNWYRKLSEDEAHLTSNILSDNQSRVETDRSGFTTAGNWLIRGTASYTWDTTEKWQEAASLKVSTASGEEGVRTTGVAAKANTTYTAGAYVKAAAGTVLLLRLRDFTNGFGGTSTQFTAIGNWQRVSTTEITGPLSVTDLQMSISTPPSAPAATFYIDGLQIEANPAATPWVRGGTSTGSVSFASSDTTATAPSGTGYYVVTAIYPDGRESAPSAEIVPYAGVGIYDAGHPLFETVGTWSQGTNTSSVLGTLHTTSASGAARKFALSAGGFRVLGARRPEYGIAGIYVNGSLASNVDLYSASGQYKQELFRREGISGPTTLEVRYTGTKNAASSATTIALDAVEVLPGDRPWFLTARPGSNQVALEWTGTNAATLGYHIDRATTSGGPYTRLTASPVVGTVYTDTTATNGTTCYYVVYGVKSGGVLTPASNEASALPLSSSLGIDGRWPFTSVPWGPSPGYIHLESGNFVVPVTDAVIPAARLAVVLRRTYNSGDTAQRGVGIGWRLNSQQTLTDSGNTVTWTDGDGSQTLFKRQGDGSYLAEPQAFATLTKLADRWEVERKDGVRHRFDLSGRMTSVWDRNGNHIDYGFDASGNLIGITPSTGNPWSLTYVSGRLSQVTDGAGRIYQYSYDGSGRLTAVTDATGAVTTYSYDGSNRLWKVTDAEGRVSSVAYSGTRISSYTDGLGKVSTFGFDSGRATVADPLGQVTTFVINGQGRLAQVIDALSQITTLTYDASGNLTELRDALGRTTQLLNYDQWGNPGRMVDAAGGAALLQYHATLHMPTEVQDPLGRRQVNQYDAAGNATRVTVAAGTADEQVFQSTYDSRGLQRTSVDPRGVSAPAPYTTAYEYSALGFLVKLTDPLGGVTAMAYDSAGNLLEQTDPLGRKTMFEYDAAGRRTRTILPDGSEETISYDRTGYVTWVRDPMGATTRYQYDTAGRVTGQVDALGGATYFEYDAAGRQAAAIDPRGSRSITRYDALGRPISTTDPVGNTASYQYDAVGNMIQTRLPSGLAMTAEYDALNRQVRMTIPPAETEVQYDALGNRVLTRDGNGNWTRYEYDNLNRLVKVYDALNLDAAGQRVAGARFTRYTYDKAGNRLTTVDALNQTTAWTYDALNRLVTMVTRGVRCCRTVFHACLHPSCLRRWSSVSVAPPTTGRLPSALPTF